MATLRLLKITLTDDDVEKHFDGEREERAELRKQGLRADHTKLPLTDYKDHAYENTCPLFQFPEKLYQISTTTHQTRKAQTTPKTPPQYTVPKPTAATADPGSKGLPP